MKKHWGFFFALCIIINFGLITHTYGQPTGRPVNDVIKLAKELMEKKEHSQAISILQDALKKRSKEYTLWMALGHAQELANDPAKALEAFKKAQELKIGLPGLALRIINLKKKVNALSINQSSGENMTSKQHEAKALLQQALKEKSQGKLNEALVKFVDCIEMDPTLLAEDQGMIQTGLKFYEKKVQENTPTGLFYFALYSHFSGNLDDAISGLKNFLSDNPPEEFVEKAKNKLKTFEEAKKVITATAINEEDKTKIPATDSFKKPVANPAVALAKKLAKTKTTPLQNDNQTTGTSSSAESGSNLHSELRDTSAEEILAKAMEMKANNRPVAAINLLTAAGERKKDPAIMMTLADLYLKVNQTANAQIAIETYQNIITRFPKSPQAAEAKSKIIAMQPPVMERARQVKEYFEQHGNKDE